MPFWLRILLFALVMILLAGGTSVYVYRRAHRTLRLGRAGRLALAGALIVAPVMVIAARLLEERLPSAAAFWLGAVGGTVLLGVWISTVLLWAVDLPAGFAAWVRRVRSPRAAQDALRIAAPDFTVDDEESELFSTSADEVSADERTVGAALSGHRGERLGPLSLGRRDAVRTVATGAALSVGFGSAFYGALFGRTDYEICEVPIAIPGLSPHLDGYRIAQLSDIHFGVYVGETELRRAVSLVRSTRADLVVLTGDLVDHDPAYAVRLGQLVRALDALGPRDGVAVIPGNHDYYSNVDVVLSAAREGGGHVLRNAGRLIGDAGGAFGLVGVDDVWATRNGYGGGPDLARALRMVPADVPKVLLCHNPEFFPEARGQVALQLSGHTHGGQVNLGVRPAELLLPYVHGVYEEGGSRLYVNRGFGTAGPPARIDAPPEVTVVVLTAA